MKMKCWVKISCLFPRPSSKRIEILSLILQYVDNISHINSHKCFPNMIAILIFLEIVYPIFSRNIFVYSFIDVQSIFNISNYIAINFDRNNVN